MLKPFCDLSLATFLALEQASIIKDLKGRERMQEERKSKSRNNSSWGGKWEGGSRRKRTYVYLWLNHVDAWQKPT